MFGIPFIKREAGYWIWVDNELSGGRADSAWTNFHLRGLRQREHGECWLKSGSLTSDLTQAQTRDGQLPLQWLKVFAATSGIAHSLPLTLLQASPDRKGSLSTPKHNFCCRNTENYSMSSIFHWLIFLKRFVWCRIHRHKGGRQLHHQQNAAKILQNLAPPSRTGDLIRYAETAGCRCT